MRKRKAEEWYGRLTVAILLADRIEEWMIGRSLEVCSRGWSVRRNG